MASELEIVRVEVETLLKLLPINLKPIPEFNDSAGQESWMASISTQITSFKNIVTKFQNMLVRILFVYNIIEKIFLICLLLTTTIFLNRKIFQHL